MRRVLEPEVMDIDERVKAYACADFGDVNASFVERLRDLMRASCAEDTAPRALDLGTGPGEIPLRLTEVCPSWQVFGLDASWPMLRLARRSLAVARADVKKLPFADQTFDIVMSNSILHHLPDPAEFWMEIVRVARDGALVFVRDLSRPESKEAAAELVRVYASEEHALLKEDFYNSFLAAFTPEEVVRQVADCGLGGLSVEKVTDRHLDVFGLL